MGASIDIVAGRYIAEVSVAHRDEPGLFVVRRPGIAGASAPQPLLRFSGQLFFGSIETGFGSIANDPSRRGVVAGSHVITDLAVDQNSGQSVSQPGVTYGNGQVLPVRVYSDGRLEFEPSGPPISVRAAELDTLDALASQGVLVDPAMKLKRSNDDYFRAVTEVVSPRIGVQPDSNGAAAMDVLLRLGAGELDTHFPHGVKLTWASGSLEIKRDQPIPVHSRLEQVGAIKVAYSASCAECGAGPDVSLTVMPGNDELRFTSDGGLSGSGMLSAPTDLTWGRIAGLGAGFAHRAIGFAEARFLMAGTFLAGNATVSGLADRPQTLLLSGVGPGNLDQFERPRTPESALGIADYPGLNFRAGADRAHGAEDILGGQPTGRWDLTGRSKYYVRASGVCGIHEALRGSFRAPPRLCGYEVTLPNYGLSFRGNAPRDSRIEGSIHLPEAANFDQNFSRLGVTCLGDPTSPELLASEIDQPKILRYWLAEFVTQGMEFRRRAADQCLPGSGVLVLAVEAYATHVATPLHGELGFLPTGEIVSAADVRSGEVRLDPPFDSGLVLPASFTLAGPADELYALTSTTKAYFTDFGSRPPDQQGADLEGIRGYLSFSAQMRLPFFNEMPVHIHDAARRNQPNAPIWIMAGGLEAAWANSADPGPSTARHTYQPVRADRRRPGIGKPDDTDLSTDRHQGSDPDRHDGGGRG